MHSLTRTPHVVNDFIVIAISEFGRLQPVFIKPPLAPASVTSTPFVMTSAVCQSTGGRLAGGEQGTGGHTE